MTLHSFKKLFLKERARFAKVFTQARQATAYIVWNKCVSDGHCRVRDLAYMTERDMKIFFHWRVLDLPKENVIGLIRHELGHVVDERISERGREQRADDLAEYVTGKKIRYDKLNIETVGSGKYPRPRSLPR